MTYCGAKCEECAFKNQCKGCMETNGKPFGGDCIAAEYIKFGGKEAYGQFKAMLLNEVNECLAFNNIPKTTYLCELCGDYVNLEYTLPNSVKAQFLDGKKIYLGAQIECDGMGICYGVVANNDFILICSYGVDGSNPELIMFKKR